MAKRKTALKAASEENSTEKVTERIAGRIAESDSEMSNEAQELKLSITPGPFQRFMGKTIYGRGSEDTLVDRIILAYNAWMHQPQEKRQKYKDQYLRRLPRFTNPRIDANLFDSRDVKRTHRMPESSLYFKWVESYLETHADEKLFEKSNAEIALDLAKKWASIREKEKLKSYVKESENSA